MLEREKQKLKKDGLSLPLEREAGRDFSEERLEWGKQEKPKKPKKPNKP
ncbi:MAG TPA: hypothetical protein PLR60_03540 [Syntrophorhabdaceae bacterium]|nr:hypothetical protein [Syntrophorhabdaceae bacterium]